MQTISTRIPSRAKPGPTKALSPSESIRHGFLGCQASARSVASLAAKTGDRFLQRHAEALDLSVQTDLREAAQLAMSHPTLATLGDAFKVADAVRAACQSVHRRVCRESGAKAQVRVQVFLAGLKAGIAELESGLERIPLLPCSAPDYPEVAE